MSVPVPALLTPDHRDNAAVCVCEAHEVDGTGLIHATLQQQQQQQQQAY
jgi:hypothetical protein